MIQKNKLQKKFMIGKTFFLMNALHYLYIYIYIEQKGGSQKKKYKFIYFLIYFCFLILMYSIFPKEKTYKDISVFILIKILSWVSQKHLEIKTTN